MKYLYSQLEQELTRKLLLIDLPDLLSNPMTQESQPIISEIVSFIKSYESLDLAQLNKNFNAFT